MAAAVDVAAAVAVAAAVDVAAAVAVVSIGVNLKSSLDHFGMTLEPFRTHWEAFGAPLDVK